MNNTENGFYGLGIAPKLLEAIERRKLTQPTPIQAQAIPVALEGKDVMGIAQTGTGKTLAFGIPMIQRLAKVKGRGLVVLPTRELALQVEEEFEKIGKHIGLRTAVLIGGQSMKPQLSQLAKKPHVIICTPGRVIDHLEQKTISLKDITVLVLDEADRMLDMGFEPQIKKILAAVPAAGERQTMLFSATMPAEITDIAKKYMQLPVRVEIARAGTSAETVEQEIFVVQKADKLRLLEKLLSEYKGTVLVFSRTKHGAKKIARAIIHMGHTATEIHSNRSLAQRRAALDGFKSGRYRVLVATDIAARGIDVKGIEVVINYDLPDQPDDYVHRIGRTGRAGHEGRAVSFAEPNQRREVQIIQRIIQKEIPRSEHGELPPHRAGATQPPRHTGQRSAGYQPHARRNDHRHDDRRAPHARGQREYGVSGFNRNNAPKGNGVLPASWNKKRRPQPGGNSRHDRRFDDIGDLGLPKHSGIKVHS